ncbi:MAG: hypothetical protein HC793_04425 [Aquincola sp.]|nr:hypothetical protein [Aquincola sp.]
MISDVARRIGAMIDAEVLELLGPNATFEQKQDAAAALASDALWGRADTQLRESVTTTEEVEVDGDLYRRLDQPSSATYHSRWGEHHVKEALYRKVGVRNGPTIKPIELRVGIVKNMTPDMARIIGELGAEAGSRNVIKVLRVTGLVPPSRAFIAKRTTEMGVEVAAEVEIFEEAAREAEPVPTDVGSVSCGMDRMAVRMIEVVDPENPTPATRTEPYERTTAPREGTPLSNDLGGEHDHLRPEGERVQDVAIRGGGECRPCDSREAHRQGCRVDPDRKSQSSDPLRPRWRTGASRVARGTHSVASLDLDPHRARRLRALDGVPRRCRRRLRAGAGPT